MTDQGTGWIPGMAESLRAEPGLGNASRGARQERHEDRNIRSSKNDIPPCALSPAVAQAPVMRRTDNGARERCAARPA
jgi:hypothetical protein